MGTIFGKNSSVTTPEPFTIRVDSQEDMLINEKVGELDYQQIKDKVLNELFEPEQSCVIAWPQLTHDVQRPDEENQFDPNNDWLYMKPEERINKWLDLAFSPYTNKPMPIDVFDRLKVRFLKYYYELFGTIDNGEALFVKQYANINRPVSQVQYASY